MPFTITSPAFAANDKIPKIYSCDDQDLSPPLVWGDPPAGTESLVLIVDDPDAPDPERPKMTWVHWLLYNLPPRSAGLPESVDDLPEGTLEGLNDWNRPGYGGPCPPIGRHRYFFRLYALDTMLPDLKIPTRKTLEKAMSGHILEQTEMMATYRRR